MLSFFGSLTALLRIEVFMCHCFNGSNEVFRRDLARFTTSLNALR